jgi:beta-1,4-N-acetylglucosaminyltransferase
MCTLLSSISYERYSPRTYIYCPGDEHSLRLIRELEERRAEGQVNLVSRCPL